MKRAVRKYDEPGLWEETLSFEQVGDSKEWIGVLDARSPGEYQLTIIADHLVELTQGKITIRAVVGKGANVMIKGVIRIRKGAQKTDNYLELRVLMLDKTSRAIAIPELEIEANDVKASHGASVGRIDKSQILYLASRGLSEMRAQEEIVNGWLKV